MSDSWLVDTFAIIGFDYSSLPLSNDSIGLLAGKIVNDRPKVLFRFPHVSVDSSDLGQIDHVANLIEFCQPNGWLYHKKWEAPQFHMIVLTDTPGCRMYAAVYNLFEPVRILKDVPGDDGSLHEDTEHEQENIDGSSSIRTASNHGRNTPVRRNSITSQIETGQRRNSRSSIKSSSTVDSKTVNDEQFIYLPKSLLIISKFNFPEIFRTCLNVVYRASLERMTRFPMELVVGNLIASVLMPPHGYPPISFTLGIGPRLSVRQTVYRTVPATGTIVYQLFHYLGIHNTVVTLCCLLNEFKVVLHSTSLNHLTQCCQAFVALLYPLPFYHVYIPVLPQSITDMLSAPTPFLIGIHSSLRHEAIAQPDLVVVDLDTGNVRLPESTRLLQLPEKLHLKVTGDLMRVLNPELFTADCAFIFPLPSFPSSLSSSVTDEDKNLMDKMIRACFLRLFASIFAGYRQSLSAIRICPEPKIVFDKAHFAGQRGEAFSPTENLQCMLLNSFFPQFLQVSFSSH